MLAHKLFQKKFDQKFLVTAWSTGATVALKKTTERKYKCSFSDQDRLAI
jgi:hypothetical protein